MGKRTKEMAANIFRGFFITFEKKWGI